MKVLSYDYMCFMFDRPLSLLFCMLEVDENEGYLSAIRHG